MNGHVVVAVAWLSAAMVLAQAEATDRANAADGADRRPPVAIGVQCPAVVWQQEPLTVTVTLDYDERFVAESAVPLFRQPTELPFHVELPWLAAAADRAVEVLPPGPGAATVAVAVGDRFVPWTRVGQVVRGGDRRERLELRCRWLPLAAGASAVAPATVRYAFATEFRRSVLTGRQPVDRQEAQAASEVLQLAVRALPQPAPPGFGGAVGRFELTASGPREPVAIGRSFTVELAVRGDGNLFRFATPVAPALPGFHVQGIAERRGDGVRTFVLDVLALRADLTAVPPLPLVVFDPVAGGYTTLGSAAVPLRVAATPGEVLAEPVQRLVDAEAERLARLQRWPWWAWTAVAALGLALAGAARWLVAGQRRRAAARDHLARLRQADGSADERLAAFEALLAQRAGAPAFTPDLFARLAANGLEAVIVQQLRAMHAAFADARFGGAAPSPAQVAAALALLAGR